jgi:preprotein translocase subunit YajC
MHGLALAILLAQADPGSEAPKTFFDSLKDFAGTPFLLMIAAVYFIMMRPMLKQNKQQAEVLKALKKDDEVATSGGIYGKIYAIDERIVTLEIANGVRIKVLRSNIAGKWNPTAPAAAAAPAKE